ncbi:MAG: hypothetical protein AB1543_06775 [Candidatus Bipolaricaulota bacterium]
MGSPGSRRIRAAHLTLWRVEMMMNRRWWLGGLFLVALGSVSLAQTTGWLNPSLDAGQFANGPRGYYRDNLYAVGADGAEHTYGGYGISLPPGSDVEGIEVLLRVQKHASANCYLYVELSWDGGVSWTATGYRSGFTAGSWWDHVLGGASDTWGYSWSPGELGDGTLRVRLKAENAARVDWVAVRIHYRQGISQSLTVAPLLVDLGVLTLAHYDAGYREVSPAQRITVSSGTAWSLHVAADTPGWIYTGSEPAPGKPCSHLEWRVSAFGSGIASPQAAYIGLTTGPQKVAGGAAGMGLWLDVALRLRVDYDTTVPGTYELRFTYTLTAP